jgi:hypothetical protein
MARGAPARRTEAMSARTLCVIGAALLLGMTAGAKAAVSADVPYVPTPWNVVETMFDMAQVTAADHLIDLGSGDGRIVIEAVKKRGARGFGIELDPHLVKIAKEEAQKQGVAGRAAFAEGNLFTFNLHEASVLTMYLYPQVLMHLRPKLFEQLKPGTRVVSHDFHMDAWKPDLQREVPVPGKSYGPPVSALYMWVIPVNAAGTWSGQLSFEPVGPLGEAPVRFEMKVAQRFQVPEIAASAGGVPLTISDAKMRGDEIRFNALQKRGDATLNLEFSGRISGDALNGTVRLIDAQARNLEWAATRSERGKIRLD